MVRFLDLRKQYEGIRPGIDEAISSVLRDSAFIGGKFVREFEARFADYQEVGHCVGVANGTDAIEIALEALGLPPGSEVIVPASGFIATAEAVTRSGHRVVFCDCRPDTYTLCPDDAERRVTPATRAIIAVHLYGHPCDMTRVQDLARRKGLRVVEDCAQAHGAEYRGRRVGGFGDAGTFSFYPGKNLGAYGDAGAVVTNDGALALRCRRISNHGRIGKFDHEIEGRNSRLDGIQAAVLGVKLSHLDSWIGRRREIAARYREGLSGIPDLVLPETAAWARPAWHLYVVRTSRREELRSFLAENGVETGIHYPVALPKLPAYSRLGQQEEPTFSNDCDRHLLSLPMGEHLEDGDVRTVMENVREFFRRPASPGPAA